MALYCRSFQPSHRAYRMGNAKVWMTYSWAFLGTVVLLCCVFILKVTVSRPQGSDTRTVFLCLLFELFTTFSAGLRPAADVARWRPSLSRPAACLYGQSTCAPEPPVAGVQRRADGKAGAETLGDGHFPANVTHVRGACQHVIGDGVRRDLVHQQGLMVAAGKGFTFVPRLQQCF